MLSFIEGFKPSLKYQLYYLRMKTRKGKMSWLIKETNISKRYMIIICISGIFNQPEKTSKILYSKDGN